MDKINSVHLEQITACPVGFDWQKPVFHECTIWSQLFVYRPFPFFGKLSYQLDFKTRNATQFDKG